jgi:hypothetical protein
VLERETGERDLPYVKIGITEGEVEERIEQLQTGNPYRLVPHALLWSEAAQLVERHLHKVCAEERVRLEWFRLAPERLGALLDDAERFNAEIGPAAKRVRELDRTPCVAEPRAPEAGDRALHAEALRLLREITPREAELDAIASALRARTGASAGIEGVTRQWRIEPARVFREAVLRERFPEVHQAYRRLEDLECRFQVEGRPTIRDFPEVQARRNAARAAVPEVDPADWEPAPHRRSAQDEALHATWLRLQADLSLLVGELHLVELRLRDRCGEHAGIEGVCRYERTPVLKLDRAALRAERPEVIAACTTERPAHLRFALLGARSYA